MAPQDQFVSTVELRRSSIEKKNYNTIKMNLQEEREEKSGGVCGFWSRLPFTGRQTVVILLLCYGNFCVGSAYSLLAPFFPLEVIF